MKSLQQVAISMKIAEALGLPEICKPLKPAPEQPVRNCFYCGVPLYYSMSNLPCLECEGTGSTSEGGCYHCDGEGIWVRSGADNKRPDAFTRDHVTPRSRGGSNRPDNIVDCCRQCNTSKGPKTLDEFRRFILIRKSPLAELHFRLIEWEESGVLSEHNVAVVSQCRASLSPCPTHKFHGESVAEYDNAMMEA